jgi:3-oxoacyl-[acyl-carrier protein] reductase
MNLGIGGRTALVTGGSRGIGRAISTMLAEEGVNVFIAARDKGNVEAAVAGIVAAGGKAAGMSTDCMTPDGIQAAVNGATAAFAAPDIAIYIPNAGIMGYFTDVTDEAFAAGDNAMVMQFARLARAVLPAMKERGWGRIVSVGTMSVKKNHRKLPHAVPNAYRLAHIGLSKSISDEMAPFGITVNTIGTGQILTDAYADTFTKMGAQEGKTLDQVIAGRVEDIPMGRLGTPQEMASACAFFCSEGASYVTGQLLVVDGGWVEYPL